MPPPRILFSLIYRPQQHNALRICLFPTQCLTRGYSAPSPRAKKTTAPRPTLTRRHILDHSTSTFPMDSFMSAYKSKALPFPPSLAHKIVRRYAELRGDIDPNFKANIGHGRTLCEEFKLEPHSLTRLGITLYQSTQSASLLRATAMHFITLGHELGDPKATIALYGRVSKSHIPLEAPRAAARDAMIRGYLSRIEKYAKVEGDAACAYTWGNYLSSRAGLDNERKEEAKGWLRTAGEKGVGEAWYRLGAIYRDEASLERQRLTKRAEWEVIRTQKTEDGGYITLQRKGANSTNTNNFTKTTATTNPSPSTNLASPEKVKEILDKSMDAFKKACDFDLPDAHLATALLMATPEYSSLESSQPSFSSSATSPPPTTQEIPDPNPPIPPNPSKPPKHLIEEYTFHLTKSASSGNFEAGYYLGMFLYYNHPSHETQNTNKVNKVSEETRLLGKEWIFCAAHGGYPDAMKVIAEIYRQEGKEKLAEDWMDAGEWQAVVGEVKASRAPGSGL